MSTLAFIGNLSPWELMIILVIALLLFGKRLPEVGRSLGKGIVEFKKGLKGVEDEIEDASNEPPRRRDYEAERAYRQPLAEGQDRRVSQRDPVEQPTEARPAGPGNP